ncbi:tetratricopeptide repeat protein [bacterium]|nr:tetratricopeptide repeat protein [bacterium]
MIHHQNRHSRIYKFLFAFIFLGALVYPSFGFPNIYVKANEEKNLSVDYSKFNKEITKNNADTLFQTALTTEDKDKQAQYLKNAAAQYYILSNFDKSDSYPCIQLARIYDLQKNDAYAKAYFYRVLGLNYKDAEANFYFAEFYYTRKQYKKALEYYHNALNYGRKDDAPTMKKIGQIYERFGDIPRANQYYKKSFELNPQDAELSGKINENIIKEYEKSGYYKRRLRN